MSIACSFYITYVNEQKWCQHLNSGSMLINKIGENYDCSPKNWVFKHVSKQMPVGRLIRWQSVYLGRGEGSSGLTATIKINHFAQCFSERRFYSLAFHWLQQTCKIFPGLLQNSLTFFLTLKNFGIPLIFPLQPWMFLAPPPPPPKKIFPITSDWYPRGSAELQACESRYSNEIY